MWLVRHHTRPSHGTQSAILAAFSRANDTASAMPVLRKREEDSRKWNIGCVGKFEENERISGASLRHAVHTDTVHTRVCSYLMHSGAETTQCRVHSRGEKGGRKPLHVGKDQHVCGVSLALLNDPFARLVEAKLRQVVLFSGVWTSWLQRRASNEQQ